MVYLTLTMRSLMIHYILLVVCVYDYRLILPTYLSACLNVLFKLWSRMLLDVRPAWRSLARPMSREAGMPSGHCQVYWAFVTSVLLHYDLSAERRLLACFVGVLVGVQRVRSRKHTLLQVLIGSLVGVSCALYIHSKEVSNERHY